MKNRLMTDRNFRFKVQKERRNTMKGENERKKNQLTRKGELVTRRNMV